MNLEDELEADLSALLAAEEEGVCALLVDGCAATEFAEDLVLLRAERLEAVEEEELFEAVGLALALVLARVLRRLGFCSSSSSSSSSFSVLVSAAVACGAVFSAVDEDKMA